MSIQNKTLASGRWSRFSLAEQLGNIGSEVERAIYSKSDGNTEESKKAFYRGLELFDLTLEDKRWKLSQLKEIARAREIVCDFLAGDNEYGSDEKFLNDYFMQFALAARNTHYAKVENQ